MTTNFGGVTEACPEPHGTTYLCWVLMMCLELPSGHPVRIVKEPELLRRLEVRCRWHRSSSWPPVWGS